MGCDTKGFIATNQLDIWKVIKGIKSFLYTRPSNFEPTYLKQVASVQANYRVSDFSKMLTVSFRDGDDDRQVSVHFDCSCDYEDIVQGDKVIFSLGCWGKSDELMLGLLDQFKEYGAAYYILNDCGEKDWERVCAAK